ncbi:prohead protease/major capsid protein fusion protein [Rhizobium sp. FKL33]|uniref:prohead protease/major capsid protein fusion protein n=1 Tax=Rhizobium sp. FKL33 TaxID=2562307 RepID=UPI0010C077E1|nr:prohead protease/major capsid protein fusion protein [Rhizobium sp. FKL33]
MSALLETFTRRAPQAGSVASFDPEDRSVEVVWSTGAAVKRYSWDEGYYMEELSMEPKAIRMDRFKSGMSLLDSHDNEKMAARLGTVIPDSVKIAGGKGYARVKLSRNQAAEAIYQDLVDGHPIQIPVGYKIHRYEKIEGNQKTLPTLRATDWEPMEISVVAIPADAGAFSRSEPQKESLQMSEVLTNEPAARADTVAERTRVKNLRHLARAAKLSDDDLDAAIDSGMSVEAFRARALDAMIARQEESPTFPIRSMDDHRLVGGMTRAQAMADAMKARVNPSHAPQAASREFVGLSLVELARHAVEAAGGSTRGESASTVLQRALHTGSDFPLALSGLGQQILLDSYAEAGSALKAVGRKVTLPDFRAKSSIRVSGFSDLERVSETGEYKRGTFKEAAESWKLDTYGKVFGLSRAMILNDQLGAFSDLAAKLGRKASETESRLLASLLESNPKMGDNVALFHANHKNLAATGATMGVLSLSAARLAFRKQVDDAGELIGVAPKYLIVPPELETAGEQLLAEIAATSVENSNPFSGRLALVVEPRLTDPKAWYLAADPSSVNGLEFGHLAGSQGPEFEERYGFDRDGLEIKIRLDFGCGFVDHRGWYKNAGPAS